MPEWIKLALDAAAKFVLVTVALLALCVVIVATWALFLEAVAATLRWWRSAPAVTTHWPDEHEVW